MGGRIWILAVALLPALLPQAPSLRAAQGADSPRPLRVAVIGGMTMTPLWGEIEKLFLAETGIRMEVVATGPKPSLARAMKEGKVDFLTMHSSDQTTNLVADGWARDLRPWAKNDLVIVGPASDPAGVAGLSDGAEAVRRIAATGSNWLDFESNGPRETAHTLFASAGVRMVGPWVLKYEHAGTADILHYVAARNAYMIVGRMPVLYGKMEPDPKVKILVEGDPVMRRPYVSIVANPERFPDANVEAAEKLSDFLLSDRVQSFLAGYDGGLGDGVPIFIPVRQPR
ncbi:MAG: substrate-binding domain-containing protein [Deltaproteobacteria bacterium]|nr:substrate-binding domain-containing protein [Deltaproteobacteria bacterium]